MPPISALSASSRSSRRATTATRAPAPARALASPAPKPEDAPVTMATRPVRSNMRRAAGAPATWPAAADPALSPLTAGSLRRLKSHARASRDHTFLLQSRQFLCWHSDFRQYGVCVRAEAGRRRVPHVVPGKAGSPADHRVRTACAVLNPARQIASAHDGVIEEVGHPVDGTGRYAPLPEQGHPVGESAAGDGLGQLPLDLSGRCRAG